MTAVQTSPSPPRRIAAARSLMWTSAALPGVCLLSMLAVLAIVGGARVSPSFIVQTPADAGISGGIGPILVSTMLVVTIALVVSAVPAVGAATVIAGLSGNGQRFRRVVESTTDVLAAVPSIIIGVAGNALFVHGLGLGYSILAGGLTLACVVLPTMTRTIASGLHSLPRELYVAGVVTGLRPARFIIEVVAPVARPIVLFGFVVGLARGLAETAALLFTSGYVDRLPGSLREPGRVLSVHIYELAVNVPGGRPSAYASGLVLVALLGVVGLLAGLMVRGGGGRGTATRAAARSMGGAG